MSDEWKIKEGRKIRVSTNSSDFEGIIDHYTMSDNHDENFLGLIDAEEVYDNLYNDISGGSTRKFSGEEGWELSSYPKRDTEKRKAGRIKIPLDKINHYEFLDE